MRLENDFLGGMNEGMQVNDNQIDYDVDLKINTRDVFTGQQSAKEGLEGDDDTMFDYQSIVNKGIPVKPITSTAKPPPNEPNEPI